MQTTSFLRLIVIFVITVTVIAPAQADKNIRPHNVIGHQIQGGLLTGYAPAGSRVYFDDQALRVSSDGRFIFGLGRQAGPDFLLTIEGPEGTRYQTTLTVAQRSYDIQRIDGLPDKKVSPNADDLRRIKSDKNAILEARRGSENTPLMITTDPDGVTLNWPVLGRISGVYGSQRILNGQPRSPHLGIDIAAPEGSPIRAPAPGRVNLVHDDMFFTGKTVMLDHGHGLTSVYAHLDQIAVQEGQKVSPGTLLGTVGSTGRSTGPHLHWGLHWYGVGLDPALLTGPMPPPETPADSTP